MKTFSIGGVHPAENKLSAASPIRVAGLPKQAVFSMFQHIGAPAKPVVKKGDEVKVGTLLAEAGGFVSAPVYSSVSGKVNKVDTALDASGNTIKERVFDGVPVRRNAITKYTGCFFENIAESNEISFGMKADGIWEDGDAITF